MAQRLRRGQAPAVERVAPPRQLAGQVPPGAAIAIQDFEVVRPCPADRAAVAVPV